MNHLILLARANNHALHEFGSRGVKRLKRKLLGKRNKVAQAHGAESYKHAKELDAYDIMDDFNPIDGKSPADIQQNLFRKRMEGMQRRRAKVLKSKRKTRLFNHMRKGGSIR